ncbi:DUF3048 domain-containing protein [Oceanobacillus halophilus]|uniref:DUF3048 domain-containing protein n=1 Tax=Oceanobacillus halophilus TaxID=930130 RepID=A0A495A4J7_9BACI|nr:DUF3048 domain-containing protein [Oceanobacillus halophilus]RKQ34619.1 DUF3048 domain-containing protein [Oceanobacillus halophilus]
MRKAIYFFLIMLVLLVGCSNGNEEQVQETDEQNAAEEPAVEEESFENIYPLTGIGTNEPVNNRIVGVMVNNHTKARPQTGLSHADIVYEILAEGMITRFLALYQSDLPEVVGPVRSAREYYFELANDYNALYVYHGAANFVNDMIVNRGVHFLNGAIYDNDGYLFKRESFRKAPHNSYLQLGSAYEVAEGKGYETTVDYEALPFLSEEEVDGLTGESAQKVRVVYSGKHEWANVEYKYDEETEKYYRFSDGQQTVELDTNEPIQLDNLFIIETHHQVIDDAGRRAIDFKSGGNGYFIQKGTFQKVEWENQDGRIIPVKDGQAIGFVPGQTWINVVPTSPGMEQSVTISE